MKETKNIFVTGASMGLGREISRFAVKKGHSVAFCARNPELVTETFQELSLLARDGQKVLGFSCDVTDIESLKRVKNQLLEKDMDISVLVCNAGVIGPIGLFITNDLNDWKSSFSVNLEGTVNTVSAFLPQMLEKEWGRVIHISGGGASAPLSGMTSYSASKVAAVRFIETLSREYRFTNLTFNSIAPGIIKSRLLDQMLSAGADKIGSDLYQRSSLRKQSRFDSTQKALELFEFLISEKSNPITGKLISAEWDDWANWTKHLPELATDVYTVRRITGRDRGFKWGDM